MFRKLKTPVWEDTHWPTWAQSYTHTHKRQVISYTITTMCLIKKQKLYLCERRNESRYGFVYYIIALKRHVLVDPVLKWNYLRYQPLKIPNLVLSSIESNLTTPILPTQNIKNYPIVSDILDVPTLWRSAQLMISFACSDSRQRTKSKAGNYKTLVTSPLRQNFRPGATCAHTELVTCTHI